MLFGDGITINSRTKPTIMGGRVGSVEFELDGGFVHCQRFESMRVLYNKKVPLSRSAVTVVEVDGYI